MSEWISVNDALPKEFVSVLGAIENAGLFPPVRECFLVGNKFFFPALRSYCPVTHWAEMPEPPKEG